MPEYRAQEAVISRTEEELQEALAKGEAAERTVVRQNAELRQRNRELAQTNDEIIEMLGDVVELRNQESGQHIQRVKAFTRVLAKRVRESLPEYGLTEDDVELITSASALHDVGKIMIPDAILLKPGRLTPEEFDIMKTHSAKGCEVLKRAPASWSARYREIGNQIVRHHHEKWDGRGYPDGLKGDEIPISAQIVSVADCFDALTTERVYKAAFSVDQAYEMILGGQCGAFSEKLMRCFRECREVFSELAEHPERASVIVSTSVYGSDKLRGLRVLLVDDYQLIREINREVLEQEGATVTEADSGEAALAQLAAGLKPDVVLMDIVMPGMDGITATRKIRETELDRENPVPIITLTAEASDEQVDACLQAGADNCMIKPLMVSEFSKIYLAVRKKEEKTENAASTAHQSAMDPLTRLKNIAAYTDQVAELTGRMAASVPPEYAIVLLDMEKTRELNEHLGLAAGDRYLRNGSEVFSSAFPHSPVYRVGGDQFLAVLQGADYQARELLMRRLAEKREEARSRESVEEGYASFHTGYAVYSPETDTALSDVVRRARAELNKKRQREA